MHASRNCASYDDCGKEACYAEDTIHRVGRLFGTHTTGRHGCAGDAPPGGCGR